MAAVGVVVSLSLRLWLADDGRFIKWNFYIPLLLLAPAGLLAAAIARGHWALRGGLAAIILALSVPALLREQPRLLAGPRESPAAPPADRTAFTVMVYNVMAYHGGEKQLYNTIRDANPDILCLVEGTFANRAPTGLVQALGKEYHWAVGERLSVASRHRIRESRVLVKTHGRLVMRALVEVEGQEVAVIVTDIWVPRLRIEDQVFPELGALVQMEEGPLVLAGDFNTPRGSVWIDRATAGLQDSLLHPTAPRYLATWPAPLPLWQIDHLFCGNGLEVHSSDIVAGRGSDHYPVMATLLLPRKSASSEPPAEKPKNTRQKTSRSR